MNDVITFFKVFFAIVGTLAFWVMLYYIGIYDGGCAHPICS